MAGQARSPGSELRIATPAAVLSTSDAELQVASADAVQVSVGRGQVLVRNDGGRLVVGGGQRAFIKDRATAPILRGTIVPAPVTPAAR
jgi:hypothetical protein